MKVALVSGLAQSLQNDVLIKQRFANSYESLTKFVNFKINDSTCRTYHLLRKYKTKNKTRFCQGFVKMGIWAKFYR